MPRNVAIVFDEDFSARLEKTAFHTPVWLVDTPANRTAAEEAWRAAVEWPHITVTLFRPPGDQPTREEWQMLLEQIEYQEKALDAIEAIGTPLTPVTHETLVESGFTRFEETAGGFRARKQ